MELHPTLRSPEHLSSVPALKNPPLDQAAEEFESVFLHTVLHEMLKSEDGGGLLGQGPGVGVLQGLLEQTLADQIANAGGFGIGEQLREALGDPDLSSEAIGGAKTLKGG